MCSEIIGDLDEFVFVEFIVYIYVGESFEVENVIVVLKLLDEIWWNFFFLNCKNLELVMFWGW